MHKLKHPLIYVAMLATVIVLFLLICLSGDQLAIPPHPPATPASPAAKASPDALLHLLIALVTVTLVARVTGMILRRFGQPPVIGEILAGIVLGPSLLGSIAPAQSAFLFPPDVIPLLGMVSQLGVILYMFLVGLRLDLGDLRGRTHVSVAVSHASIVLPFILGATLALWLYPRFSSRDVGFPSFALFIGVSMSVTAFPVLARILAERRLTHTPLGAIALTCAAVDDVTSWCLLALLVGTVHATFTTALATVALAGAFTIIMLFVIRPIAQLLRRARDRHGELTQGMFLVACVGLLLSAVATEQIGIHALFGAFLWGTLIPRDSALARDLAARLEDFVVVMLLPSFFAFVGMRTHIHLFTGDQLLACALIVAIASLGKFGGSALAALATGLPRRDACALGILMNTRGLMELVVLNVGLELGVIAPSLFTLLVVMAVVTTFATTPILDRFYRPRSIIEAAPATRA